MRSIGHRAGGRARGLVAMFTAIIALGACGPRTADIAAFAERRGQCDHFRGEDPYDKARAEFLREQFAKYCSGTDAELATLKQKYARDSAVMKSLDAYEERVE